MKAAERTELPAEKQSLILTAIARTQAGPGARKSSA